MSIYYNDKALCDLDFSTENMTAGQSVGMLLTKQGDLHWFLDDKWRGMVHVDGYPLNKPIWGVADMFRRCEQVTAEILTGESCQELIGTSATGHSRMLDLAVYKRSHSTKIAQGLVVCISHTVSKYNPSSERQLLEMGLIKPAQ